MSRRNEPPLEILLKAPWWVSAGLAVLSFILLRWIFPALYANNPTFKLIANGVSAWAGYVALFFIYQSPRACIREAIGQLLEYAFWPGAQEAIHLTVAGESPLDPDGDDYLRQLRDRFGLPIDYQQITVRTGSIGSKAVEQDMRESLKHTRDQNSVQIQWHVRSPSEIEDALGHGIHYHDKRRPRSQSMVAYIDGYDWLGSKCETVTGYHIPPDAITTPRVLAAMKKHNQSLVAAQELIGCGDISRRIYCIANG